MTKVFPSGDARIKLKSRAEAVIWKILRWEADDQSRPVEDRERTLSPKGSVNEIEQEIAACIQERGETTTERWRATKADPAGRDPRLAMMWKTSGSLYAAYVDREAA